MTTERILDVLDRTLAQVNTGGLTGLHLKDARGRCIDLRWHLLLEGFDAALDRELLATSVSIDLRGEPARSLAPCEHLLEIVCHGLSWAEHRPRKERRPSPRPPQNARKPDGSPSAASGVEHVRATPGILSPGFDPAGERSETLLALSSQYGVI